MNIIKEIGIVRFILTFILMIITIIVVCWLLRGLPLQ